MLYFFLSQHFKLSIHVVPSKNNTVIHKEDKIQFINFIYRQRKLEKRLSEGERWRQAAGERDRES